MLEAAGSRLDGASFSGHLPQPRPQLDSVFGPQLATEGKALVPEKEQK